MDTRKRKTVSNKKNPILFRKKSLLRAGLFLLFLKLLYDLESLFLFFVAELERIDKKSCILLKSIVKYIHKKDLIIVTCNSSLFAEWIGM